MCGAKLEDLTSDIALPSRERVGRGRPGGRVLQRLQRASWQEEAVSAGAGRGEASGPRPEGLCVSRECSRGAHLMPTRTSLGGGRPLETSHLANMFETLEMGPHRRQACFEAWRKRSPRNRESSKEGRLLTHPAATRVTGRGGKPHHSGGRKWGHIAEAIPCRSGLSHPE